MKTTAPAPIRAGEIVKVADYDRAVWRVLSITDGLAWLTKLNSFERVDYYAVAIARLARATSGILS